jgi:hypothetical protein
MADVELEGIRAPSTGSTTRAFTVVSTGAICSLAIEPGR